MKADKELNGVKYYDKEHIYISDEEKYTSVTTLISKYKEPFDEEFFSQYKAVERIMGEGDFQSFKMTYGYKNVISKWKELNPDKLWLLNDVTKVILEEWKNTRNKANIRGTKYHKEKEDKWIQEKVHTINGRFYNVQEPRDLSKLDSGIYPELLVVNHEYKLAGQADLVIIDGNNVEIYDWKTNKKLDLRSYQNPKTKKYKYMLYPLNNIEDCHLQHYTLQLSLYGWMLEQYGYRVRKLMIEHCDHDDNITEYKVKYKKNTIKKLLKHWYER